LRFKSMLMVLLCIALMAFMTVPIPTAKAHELHKFLLGTQCTKLYYLNGTPLPPTNKPIGHEVITWKNPYTNKTMYVNATVFLSSYVRINEWWYDPNETALHINLTGIIIRKEYYFRVNITVGNKTVTISGSLEGNETIISGYGEFVSYISTDFPKPQRVYQVFENGTIFDLNYTCTKGTDPMGRSAWIIKTLIHFSNPVVVIQGKMRIGVVSIYVFVVAVLITVIVVVSVILVKKRDVLVSIIRDMD